MTSTTVDALKNLYAALGGDASDVADLNVIPDVINAIAGLGAIAGAGAISVDSNGRTIIQAAADKDLIIKTTGDGNLNITSENELSLTGEYGLYMNSTDGDVSLDANNAEVDITANSRLSLNSLGSIDAEAQSGDFSISASDGDLKLSASGAATLNNKAIATTT